MMEKVMNMLFTRCPKSGRITGIKFIPKWYTWFLLPVVGFLATVWVLFRVIPKPSRLAYPCVRVALPISTSFLVMLTGLSMSAFSVTGLKRLVDRQKSYFPLLVLFLLTGVSGLMLFLSGSSTPAQAVYQTSQLVSNNPMGEAKGINPGRVVWVHDPDATNEFCTNSYNGDGVGDDNDDAWFLNKNTDQDVVDRMLSDALRTLTDTETDAEAWDLLFRYHNNRRGKGDVGYQPGEIVFFKINATSNWGMGEFWGNIDTEYRPTENEWYGMSETSPQIVMALLRQLVNTVGVAQEDIYIGDPMRHVYSHSYELWTSEFPNIHIMDHDHATMNRVVMTPSTKDTLFFSDRGTVLDEEMDFQYRIFHDCEYLFNLPMMKGHKNAGCTMFAKNHFGSHSRESAEHYHPSLLDPDGEQGTADDNFGYKHYRVLVDLMGYELFREKYVVMIMDALWSSGMELEQPCKWQMPPFNNDWSSSIFVSQDPVAIESVGFDFLHAEFTVERHPDLTFVQMEGTDDYLRQAASSDNWPEGIVYDPEKDGTPLPSLGVNEHWNNEIDKQYSRNLGSGEGIELVAVQTPTKVEDNDQSIADTWDLAAYPNPFNPSVNLQYYVKEAGTVSITIYNHLGQQVWQTELHRQPGTYTEHIDFSNTGMSSGTYLVRMQSVGQVLTQKICYLR